MPKSFLITNRRYRRQQPTERGDSGIASLGFIGEAGELDPKTDAATCYRRFGGSIGSSELDIISEPSEDSYLKG